MHGQHCFDEDGRLVCGWPEAHADFYGPLTSDEANFGGDAATATDQNDPNEDMPREQWDRELAEVRWALAAE